jgi:hypothetical protein
MMPEQTQGSGNQGAGTPPTFQAQTPPESPAPQQAQTSPPPVSGAGVGAPGPTPGASQAAQEQSVRDYLAERGLDLRNHYQDDHAVLNHLAEVARQAQELAQYQPYVQQYMQHAGQFQQWLAEQQRQRQAQQAQQQQWWNAPEYDPSWASKIYRDEQGQYRVLPGNDPAIINKYLAWAEHQKGFFDKFARDPIAAIRPGIEQVIQEVAGRMVQQHLGQYQEQTAAQTFIEQNSDWLHEKDQSGRAVLDPRTGRPALSSLGRQFAQYVFEAERLGLQDTASQQRYAMGLVQRDFLLARAGQAQAPPPDAAPGRNPAAQQFLQQAAQQRQQPQVQQPPGNSNGSYQSPSGPTQRGLQELLMREFAAAGIQPGQQLV